MTIKWRGYHSPGCWQCFYISQPTHWKFLEVPGAQMGWGLSWLEEAAPKQKGPIIYFASPWYEIRAHNIKITWSSHAIRLLQPKTRGTQKTCINNKSTTYAPRTYCECFLCSSYNAFYLLAKLLENYSTCFGITPWYLQNIWRLKFLHDVRVWMGWDWVIMTCEWKKEIRI